MEINGIHEIWILPAFRYKANFRANNFVVGTFLAIRQKISKKKIWGETNLSHKYS